MTRTLILIAAFLTLSVPAALAVPPEDKGKPDSPGNSAAAQSPAQLCAEQLRTMGAANFRTTYAPNGNGKNSMGRCVSRQNQVADTAADNAAKKCKAERADANFATSHQGKTFKEYYGTNPNQANAFGKCVSKYAKQQSSS